MEAQSISSSKRVAVIGTGLAGLTTGYLLQGDERYNVTLFEQVRHPTRQVLQALESFSRPILQTLFHTTR